MELMQSQPATQTYQQAPGYFKRLTAVDWLFALALLAAAIFGLNRYGHYMDIYEQGILLLSAPTFAALGWHWKPVRWLMPLIALLSLWAVSMYGGQLDNGSQKFWLRMMLSSQSAVLWMSVMFVISTVFYWIGFIGRSGAAASLGTKLSWAAVVLGWTGMMVRWYESYLIGADVGHIPVSNLYEVFILFSLITAMFYLYFEQRYATRQMGPFVLLVISAAIGFLMWYTTSRNAADIQPLLPALQSWWMKIHVPANFIGYGNFALAAMVASAYLLKTSGYLKDRLPSEEVLDDVMYKAISAGFAFFTIATILGALWAAEAWGGYWSWDPKETWALIVWLNYAAWLHMRLMTGLRGRPAAWWALVGLLVTTFAFLGVNMFLSGLHSYGKL
ncbi:c-type cytochrome biogenesis protein CcsB [Duganella sp. FT50W]|uniref:C-type cytochrome biogenesis protein CcsB n=1 Tax=Duganella lactea TaxID=2692173 RepID=A0A6L8MR34_9BURK|nr:c-type cytochrome biogenesis protein CcsB [Duganella lactea]MYM37281.1 c-type cytochrome biogenesis protein CcsB [Duganella lactea]MYM84208.1 c-type cytochrome biogenesis protein CcsB [Duganella lactea]